MVVHDEDTLNEALVLVEQGPVRYSDQFAYVVVTSPNTLERLAMSAFNRGDVAVVVPQGLERSMEDHSKALARVKQQRRAQELKDVRAFMAANPGFREALRSALEENPRLDVAKFVSKWRKVHA